MTAYFDGEFCWAKDLGGHGGSAYKVYIKSGNRLIWYRDADIYGNFIFGKYKGGIGRIINL